MHLTWHNYKYYPYEKDLAAREINSLLSPTDIKTEGKSILISGLSNPEQASRLVYFADFSTTDNTKKTQQSLLERVNGNGVKRQSTRYSAHGLHEYKGKFNPQIAKALLNIFSAQPGQNALDPFCGSGTSLVESAHLGIHSVGTDINPLAVFIANAKLQSLGIPAEQIINDANLCLSKINNFGLSLKLNDERGQYLQLWFPEKYLLEIEMLINAIRTYGGASSQVLLAIASNLLRDYSLQEPQDLRIRRRKSPFPTLPFFNAFEGAVKAFATKLFDSQQTLGVFDAKARAINIDSKQALDYPGLLPNSFDLALTSPPYATALPYIDTQRLSLVWLGLLAPSAIASLEAELVGSREIRGKGKKELLAALEENRAELPDTEANLCLQLQNALTEDDGFRRQAVPRLLYRYFLGMSDVFSSVGRLLKANAPFGLIIGGNHTVLGGTRFDINTPQHLANLAVARGWQHVETVPLQTYQRFGLHANNATTTEALVILKARPD
jgi:site-specific DNA-methyltransferase (cytosine-N4-specific)